MAASVHPLKLCSLLLCYPDAERREASRAALDLELDPARSGQAGRLREFCRWYADQELGELERAYVESFDLAKRSSLHLTYHVHGDRRQRGVALLRLKQAYRAAGLEAPADELPDFLPLMLEFATLAPRGQGLALLEEHRVAIELIHGGLQADASPFAPLLGAVVESLPRLSTAKLARIRRLAAEGPPTEEVGLEPFAPPEVMPSGDPSSARPLVGGIGAP